MENIEKLKDRIKTCCLEKEDPYCVPSCPFHLDVREFISKLQRGSFNLAYRLYSNAVGFPFIISELCDAPCKAECVRENAGGAVALNLLERACVDYSSNTNPNSYNLPAKDNKIAVIGAGISGLACALRLMNKKYSVSIYEKSSQIGGRLWGLMPPEFFLRDIERQFMYEKYDLYLDTEITDLNGILKKFDACYVATGQRGDSFGLLKADTVSEVPLASNMEGVFLGGALCGAGPAEAAAHGLKAAGIIEAYIKTGNMKGLQPVSGTKIKIDSSAFEKTGGKGVVIPTFNGRYTKEEAAEEANRCIKCRCDSCAKHCGLMEYFGKMPKRIEEEVHITINPGTLDGNGTVATRFISTCNQCGLCKEVCPEEIDMGMFLRQSHNIMRDKNAMPWAFHEFWLRDMEHANSEKSSFCHIPDGHTSGGFLFFPGCQLGASDPAYVINSYRFLLGAMPDTSLLLMCCGAPAVWSGDHKLYDDICRKITEKWIELGSPVVVFACSSCRKFFEESMPYIKSVSLYEIMLQHGIECDEVCDASKVSVFDPCSARGYPETRDAVRSLLRKAGYETTPLPYEGRTAQCCSWGGQISVANPKYTDWLINKRIRDGDSPYVVYCSNCRDIFAAAGKPARHILDVIFGKQGWNNKPPTLSERRRNRENLRMRLAREFGDMKEQQDKEEKKEITMSLAVEEKLDREKILEDDVIDVISHCESGERYVLDPVTGHRFGYHMIGHMTCWAEYTKEGDGYRLFNAYTHRMKIELEEVWNGRKQKNDMQ